MNKKPKNEGTDYRKVLEITAACLEVEGISDADRRALQRNINYLRRIVNPKRPRATPKKVE